MTLFVPLDENQSPPTSPSFLVHSDDVIHQLRKALRTILKARRLVVVCGASPSADSTRNHSEYQPLCIPGAGISVQAGIPDFRSPTGLFQTLKRDNPKESLSSGKDLFDASVFNVSAFPHHVVCPASVLLLSAPACLQPYPARLRPTPESCSQSSIVRTHNLVILSNDRSIIRAIAGREPHPFPSVTSHPRRTREALARVHTKHRRDRIKVWSLLWCPRVRRQALQASIKGKDVSHHWPRRSHPINKLHPVTAFCFPT